jgi:glycosyltransferase involved in cell wall biosynthesis
MQGLLTIIIPVYNELELLPTMAPQIIAYCLPRQWQVIFVNDGSRDGSGKYLDSLVNSPAVRVLHHKVNRGYGGALKTGILNVTTPYCITIDADGQHNLNDVESMFHFVLEKDADMAVGNRGTQGNANAYRAIGKSKLRLQVVSNRSR